MSKINLQQVITSFMDEIWNSGNFQNIKKYIASAYEIIDDPGDPWNGQTLNHDDFIKRVMYSRKAFPDLLFDIQEMISSEEKIAIRWVMSGTHKGDLLQLPAMGKKFSISGMTFYYFNNEKVCGHRQSFDQSEKCLKYNLGMWSGFRMDYDSLDIYFDENGRYFHARIVQH